MSARHFLTLADLNLNEAKSIIDNAITLKAECKNGVVSEKYKNRVLGMIFEKSSTRTRVSFEVGMVQFGGSAIFLSPHDTQLGRGEPVADSAKVLSRMVDMIMIRTFEHAKIEEFAANSQVPVINGLTDEFHPCQLLADIQTYVEHRGNIEGKSVAWIGDGNNMCHSYMNAAKLFDFELKIACPSSFGPNPDLLSNNKNAILVNSPEEAVNKADLVVTDVWASMGQESEQEERVKVFSDYQVSQTLLDKANEDVLFMHCLPAHRGEEVTDGIMADPRAVIWDEAENRLHAQKALIDFLFEKSQ